MVDMNTFMECDVTIKVKFTNKNAYLHTMQFYAVNKCLFNIII